MALPNPGYGLIEGEGGTGLPNPGFGDSLGGEPVPMAIKANGIVTGAGAFVTTFGIASTTLVSTGRLRLNFEVPYEAGDYFGYANGVRANSTNIYWTRPGNLNVAYLEVLTYFGNPVVFAVTNPSYITFECRELT